MSLNLNGKNYLSAREAAELTSYSPDYISRLCRTGEVAGERVGRAWYVDRDSLFAFVSKAAAEEKQRRESLRAQRIENFKNNLEEKVLDTAISNSTAPQYAWNLARVTAGLVGALTFGVAFAFGYFSPIPEKIVAGYMQAVPGTIVSAVSETPHVLEFLGQSFVSEVTFALDEYKAHIIEPGESAVAIAESANSFFSSLASADIRLGNRLASLWNDRAIIVPELISDAQSAYVTSGQHVVSFSNTILSEYAAGIHESGTALSAAVLNASDIGSPNVPAYKKFFSGVVAFFAPKENAIVQTNTRPPSVVPPVKYVPVSPGVLVQRTGTTTVTNNYSQYTTVSGVSEATLALLLNQLENKIKSSFNQVLGSPTPYNPPPASGGVSNVISLMNNIDHLDGVILNNPTIIGGSISGTSGIGSGSLTGSGGNNTLAIWNGSSLVGTTTPVVDYITATSTATSTFAGGLSIPSLLVTNLVGCDTIDTDANGQLHCGTDQTGSGSGTPGGANNEVQFNNNGSFGGDAGFTYSSSTDLLTITNASTTRLTATYASSTNAFFGSVTIGTLSGILKATAGAIGTALVNLATDITGILPVANGGTGWATGFTANSVLIGNGTGAIATTSAGTNGQVLALVGGVPTWTATSTLATITGTLGVSQGGTGLTSTPSFGQLLIGNGSGYTLSATSTLAIALSDTTGTLPTTRGGTNITTYTTGDTLYASATNVLSKLAIGTGGQVLAVVGGIPSWVATTTLATISGTLNLANQVSSFLAVGNGGTGTSTAPTYGQVLLGNNSGGYDLVATSSLGITSSASSASTDKFATSSDGVSITPNVGQGLIVNSASSTFNGLNITRATTTNASSTNLFATNLTLGITTNALAVDALGKVYGFATSTLSTISGLLNLATQVSGILPVTNGGTGWANIFAGAIPYGNGTGAFSTTTAGTAGNVLALLNGVPTWTATSTLSTISGTLALSQLATQVAGTVIANGTGGTASPTAIATSSLFGVGTNGFVLAEVNGVPTWTATSTLATISGTLGVANGGTGNTTFTASQLLYGNGTAALSSIATSSVSSGTGISFTGTPGALVGGTALTITNSGVTSNVAGSGISVSGATGAVTISTNGLNAVATTSDIAVSQLAYISKVSGLTTLASVATTTFTPSSAFTVGGTIGNFVGGANSTLDLANNGVSLTKLATIAANSILGNNTGATGNVTAFATSTLFGTGTNGFVLAEVNGVPTWTATTTLATITGTLTTDKGGTNITTYTTGDTLYASATNVLSKLAIGTGGQVLAVVSGIPQWVATTTLSTISGTLNLATQVAGTLGVTNGGTGWATGFTANSVLIGNGTGAIATTSAGTNGQTLALVSGVPTWVSTTTAGTGLTYNGTSFNVDFSSVSQSKWATSTLDAGAITPNSALRVGLGTTTPRWALQIASSTGPQLALSDGSLTSDHWTFRSVNGSLYIATSSAGTFATSTATALTIDANGNVGVSSTTPGKKFAVAGSFIADGGGTFNANTTEPITIDSSTFATAGNIAYKGGNFLALGTTANTIIRFYQGNLAAFGIHGNASVSGLAWSRFYSRQGTNTGGYATTSSLSIEYPTLHTQSRATSTIALFIPTAPVGPGLVDNSYGLYVEPARGALNNYAGVFTGGNLGVGTTSPYAQLAIHAASTTGAGAPTALFVVASSSQGTATTTLFTINNQGNVAVSGTLNVTGNTTLGNVTLTNASTTNITSSYASTSVLVASNSFTLANLTGFLKATAGAVTTATIDLVNDVGTSILAVANGGTGWANLQANTVLLGNGTGRVATTSAGTNGQVLALVGGVPTWTATTTLATISGTLAVANGGTGQTSFGQGILAINDSGAFVSTTSPVVNAIIATSTTATSTFNTGIQINNKLGTTAGVLLTENDANQGDLGVRLASTGAGGGIKAAYLEDITSSVYRVDNTGLGLGSTLIVGWGAGSNGNSTKDTSLSRISAGVVGVGTGASGSVAGGFLANKIGVGTTTSPWAQFAIHAASTTGATAPTTLLVIASSSQGTATTTLFSVSNTGVASTTALVVSGQTTLASSLTGFLKATAGAVTTATIDLVNDVGTSILAVANGGTGWANLQANTVLLGNGTGRVATTSAGTNGQVLALVGGVPTWTATTTLATISGTLAVANGGTGQTSFGQGWLGINDSGAFISSTSPTVNYITATSTATSAFAGGVTVSGTLRALGSVTESALGLDRLDFGVLNGTPRMVFEDAGNTIWEIVNDVGNFRIVAGSNVASEMTQSGAATRMDWYNNGVSTVSLNTNGVSYLNGGNVGIGTTTPRFSLTIASSTGPQLALQDLSTTSSPWTFRSLNGNLFVATSSSATFATSSVTALTINTSGNAVFGRNVGIGVTNPTERLTAGITGGSIIAGFQKTQATDDTGAYLSLRGGTTGGTDRGFLGFTHTGAGGDTIFTGELADALAIRATGAFQLGTNGDNIRLTVTSGGNVGISNATPTYNLDVTGAGHFTGLVDAANFVATSTTATSTFAGGLNVKSVAVTNLVSCDTVDTDANGQMKCGTDATGGGGAPNSKWATSTDPNNLSIYPNAATLVGIGTTTPRFALQIASSTGPQLALTDSSSNAGHWTFRNLNGDLTIATSSSGAFTTTASYGVTITNAGNLGIKTSSPSAALDINGYGTPIFSTSALLAKADANAASGIEFKNVNTGGAADMRLVAVSSDGAYFAMAQPGINNTGSMFGLNRKTTSLLFNIANGGTERDMAIGTLGPMSLVFGTNSTERGRFDALGNFGVGSTTPYAQLAVHLASTTKGLPYAFVIGSSTAGTATTTLFSISSSGAIAGTGPLSITSATASSTFTWGVGANSLAVTNLVSCDTIDTDANGQMKCGTDATGGGASTWPFTTNLTNFGQATQSTTTALWLKGSPFSLFASSTSVFDNASTTLLSVGTQWFNGFTSGELATDGAGKVYQAATTTAGTGLTYTGTAFNVNASQNISTLSNLTTNGVVYTSGGTGALNTLSTFAFDGGRTALGIGTSTPRWSLQIASSTGPQLALSDGSQSNSPWTFRSINGNFYLASSSAATFATTSTYAAISVLSSNNIATTSINTGFNVGNGALTYDTVAGLTSVANLALGSMTFDTDSGQVSWIDMPVTSNASAGTVESYTAGLDGTSVLTVYGVSNGAGGVATTSVGVGTTTPFAKFAVNPVAGDLNQFLVGSSTATSLLINNAGNIGIGTSTPWASFAINPIAGRAANQFVVGSSTATNFIIDNSGKVGIGTTSPSSLFSIQGTANFSAATTTFSSSGGIDLKSGGCFAINGTCLSTSGGAGGTPNSKWATSTDPNNLSISPNSALLVGIGTTTPRFSLTIASSTGPQLALQDTSTTSTPWTFRSINGNLYIATSSTATFATSTIAALSIFSTGNVQFGANVANTVTTPLVVGLGGTYGSNTAGSSGNLKLQLYNDGGGNIYGLGMSGGLMEFQAPSSGGQAFFIGGSEKLRVASNGNIGIGSSTPILPLSIGANGSFGGFQYSAALSSITTSGPGILFTGNTGYDGRNWQLVALGSGNTAIGSTGGFSIVDRTAALSRLLIDSSGRTGIGTTTPGAMLSLSSSASEALYLDNPSGQFSVMRYLNAGVIKASTYWDNTNSKLENSISSTGNFTWVSNGSEWMRIGTTGNVGIGTTTPDSLLTVGGLSTAGGAATNKGIIQISNGTDINAGASGLEFKGSSFQSGFGWKIAAPDRSNSNVPLAFAYRNNSATWTEALTISSGGTATAGTVGIGTTTPAAFFGNTSVLTINANYGSNSALTIATSSASGVAQMSFVTDSKGYNVGIGGATANTFDLANKFYVFDNNNLVARMVIDTNGKLGIGTTSPGFLLSTSGGKVAFKSTASTTAAFGVENSYGKNVFQVDTFDTANNIFEIATSTGTAYFDVTATGNVGIGSTSPASLLTIVGGGVCISGSGASVACGNTAGTLYYRSASAGNYDVAENYLASDLTLSPGKIATLDLSGNATITTAGLGSIPFGVISTAPGLLLGGSDSNANAAQMRAVALSGRVPVAVNLDGGPISVGDAITLSTEAGIGMKATTTTNIIGFALEPYNGTGTSTVEVFIRSEYWFASKDRSALASLFSFGATTTATSTPSSGTFMDTFLSGILARVNTWLADATNGISDLFANKVHTKEICVGDAGGSETCLTKAQLDALIAGAAGSGSTPPPVPPPSGGAPDTEAPVITILGNNPATVNVGDTYADLGATVTDNVDQNIGIHIYMNGAEVPAATIDTSAPGTFEITYKATDQAGNEGSAVRTVQVVAP